MVTAFVNIIALAIAIFLNNNFIHFNTLLHHKSKTK